MICRRDLSARSGFLHGINVPWFNADSYGCDIGCSHRRMDSRFDPARVEAVFRNGRSVGFDCIRIWLFEIMEGIRFDADGFATGFDPFFVRNLHTLLDIAGRIGIDLLVTFQPHISFSMQYPDEYGFYTRILHEPRHTDRFITNCVRPLARLLAACPQVMMVDLYAEPEGDVTGPQGNGQPYGGSWDSMHRYLAAVAGALREEAPGLPLTVASGWRKYDSLREGRYNDLGLDCIGVDIYDDAGIVEPAATLGTDGIPVWLAEFGPETKDDWDEETYTQNTLSFYRNARAAGYIGAFHWMYGYAGSGESLTLEGKDGRLRPVADHIRALVLEDRAAGGEPPRPELLSVVPGRAVEWFPVPDAVSYTLERTGDLRRWSEVTAVPHNPGDPVSRLSAADPAAGSAGPVVQYRVRANLHDGREVFSGLSNPVSTGGAGVVPRSSPSTAEGQDEEVSNA